MDRPSYAEMTAVASPTLRWKAEPDNTDHWRPIPTIARRIAYVLQEPGIDREGAAVTYERGASVITGTVANAGVPVRNQLNKTRLEWGNRSFVITLRETDSFGEVLIDIDPARGSATAYSITIDRTMKGGVSYASPRPEEQMIRRIDRFGFEPVAGGEHELCVEAVEEKVKLSIDGREVITFDDPDVMAGCFGIGAAEPVRVLSFEQIEYITREEADRRSEFVRKMNEFCRGLDAERDADIARANSIALEGDALTWRYPETGATLELQATPGRCQAEMHAGLYGNARLLDGLFACPEVTATSGEVYRPAKDRKPALEGDALHWRVTLPLQSDSGGTASMSVLAKFTENATWFCTAEVEGIEAKSAALAFGLDPEFRPNQSAVERAGEPAKLIWGTATMATGDELDPSRTAFGLPAAAAGELPTSFLCTDGVAGHCWKALSGSDTRMELVTLGSAPALVLRSARSRFRWAIMWLPYHKLNLTGYKKRMLHFIRYSELPSRERLERPSVCQYPTDQELERYAANGVRAMVWHHTWAGNDFRRRDGFVVNEPEMRRAMDKAHELGIEVITYIGIVPGRHPALRYEDLAGRMFYDKNWDLQDFTIYTAAGRFAEFFPYMTDYWCREFGLDGYYTDGGLTGLDWGRTGLSEADCGGLSIEELNDRLYSRVKRVLRRHRAGFGLENWGASGVHLAGPWYECRMIGETYQEYSPETYRDTFNPLVTGTPFKMYGMDLVARNRYNVAMAAVCMTDIQICSGNYAWGCWPDAPSDWANLRPFWSILDSIDWDDLVEARPWWAQKLVKGEGFFAGYYITPRRAVLFLASRTEEKTRVGAAVQLDQLPEPLRGGRIRPIYPETGEWSPLGDGSLTCELPRLHDGPVGFEVTD